MHNKYTLACEPSISYNSYKYRFVLKMSGPLILCRYNRMLSVSARNHGETCFSNIECVDHRMLCEANVTDSSVKRCYCDR
jgi:hypothetical protein